MTDETNDQKATNDRLATLKERATQLGIQYHPSIGVEALAAKVNAKLLDDANMAQEQAKAELEEDEPVEQVPLKEMSAASRRAFLGKERQKQHDEQMKLIRVRITCMNPAKKDLNGEIITFSNNILGSVKMFVPFGEVTDNGWHIPQCIYQLLKDRKFNSIRSKTGANGLPTVDSRLVPEFSIEVMDPLTKEEIEVLAKVQNQVE